MNKKNIRSLRLGKETIQDLNREEQKMVLGGSVVQGMTQVPIFCKPST